MWIGFNEKSSLHQPIRVANGLLEADEDGFAELQIVVLMDGNADFARAVVEKRLWSNGDVERTEEAEEEGVAAFVNDSARNFDLHGADECERFLLYV